ncbi:peptide deformylase [Acidithiobacillus thiooxidans]|uniref:Peptide deformylase n=2 Tax=Acidithiobacillus thiooxidans TaxID=930 RepID=A0A1C2JFZ1_ACITH|nr:peptide deformylase [Acidithiobacillus thiooxidans]MDR7928642.1 peptide deformylase [Acidithiobacillus thiooxidans]MDX5933644.1 peptide deformylase [Acidithiobacillus thiooxidans]OCX67394.1 peptide deformylase [Acidithiobacillus thiooxidans]OCX69357.1 peptide deformylase [Acidithiobacillus thiooxidans]OCX79705.1 peptide deformylase [Acidithiobacillus thiooxidans]
MSLLKILEFPDQRLKNMAQPIVRVDKKVQQLADDMAETMYDAPGIGLAAPQVAAGQRLIVVDVSENRNDLMVLVNPEIIARSGEEEMKEGCLSVPGVLETVRRAEKITLRATTVQGKLIELEADGLLAVCIQHEIDHLNGTLFVDHLSRLKQNLIRRKAEKRVRQGE